MGLVTYDLILLALFILVVIIFLSSRKKNLSRQGIVYLYRTKIGIRFIDKFAKKYEDILKPLRYVVIASGYVLLVTIVWLFVKTTWIYLTSPLVRQIFKKTPPIAPIIPYFPKLFGLEAFFPPLYFTYFIIAIATVALGHEFAHGIFARLEKFKIHSTGFAFLGPIPGAFVEPDEKQMSKAPKFQQLSVLAAGTFANVIMTIIFGALLALFFTSLFSPIGVKFNSYVFSEVAVEDIEIVRENSIGEFIEINIDGKTFFTDSSSLDNAKEKNAKTLIVFDDTPAFRAQLNGAITELNGKKITNQESLSETLSNLNPGDEIKIRTAVTESGRDVIFERKEYDVTLAERNGKAFLGIAFFPTAREGILGKIYANTAAKIKEPLVLYESKIGEFGWFIYYLLWWLIFINLAVALFNMLPLGILDGGRFFYLTMCGITGSEKIGKKAYSLATWFLLALIALMMFRWLSELF